MASFFPMVLRAYWKLTDDNKREINHIEKNLKMNSKNTIKVQNPKLKKMYEEW